MSDDPLSAELAATRSLIDAYAPPFAAAGNPLAYKSRRLLAAVEAVLELHHPDDRGRVLPCCAFCCTEDECIAWIECLEREVITRALTGEDSSG